MLEKRKSALFIVAALLSLCLISAIGQSGRRGAKSTSPPPPTPEPSPSPTPKNTDKDEPRLALIVGIDGRDSFSRVPLYAYDVVVEACVERLGESPSVTVIPAGRDMTRGDAVTRAKEEKDGYIVWLQLRSDSMSNSSGTDLSNAYIEYSVFAPQTAKLAAGGSTYPQAYRNKNVILKPRSGVYGEYELKQASRDAAERILKALHISTRKLPTIGP